MKNLATMLLHEKLDYISQPEESEQQVQRAREIAQMDATFPQFMRMAGIVEEKITGIPEGMPDIYKPETAIPDGISFTTARQEFRRIKNFQMKGSMQTVPKHRRETSWLQMLEGMHWKEANILVHVKDQTLFNVYPNMFEVLTKLGMPINLVKEEKNIKKRAKKT